MAWRRPLAARFVGMHLTSISATRDPVAAGAAGLGLVQQSGAHFLKPVRPKPYFAEMNNGFFPGWCQRESITAEKHAYIYFFPGGEKAIKGSMLLLEHMLIFPGGEKANGGRPARFGLLSPASHGGTSTPHRTPPAQAMALGRSCGAPEAGDWWDPGPTTPAVDGCGQNR